MTIISLRDFRLHLDRYLAAATGGDVVVTQDGEPWRVLRAVENDQDRLSVAYANSAAFRQLIEERRREQSMPWIEAKKQLDPEHSEQ
jgi:antitoxin (DNA-binding transcriptional repressor) of toxin-antitoxin stability system